MLPVLTDGSNRTAQQDVVLGGHRIPKGTMVWLFFNGLFNSTASWGDPAVYRPVRAPHCCCFHAALLLTFGTCSPRSAAGRVCTVATYDPCRIIYLQRLPDSTHAR